MIPDTTAADVELELDGQVWHFMHDHDCNPDLTYCGFELPDGGLVGLGVVDSPDSCPECVLGWQVGVSCCGDAAQVGGAR